MKVELRNLNFLCPGLDCNNVCPACPKVRIILIIITCIVTKILLCTTQRTNIHVRVYTTSLPAHLRLIDYYSQESGTVVYAMDALFGLPRKKAAGTSCREALHGQLFFENQEAVDEYVYLHTSDRTKSQVKILSHELKTLNLL